MSKECCGIIYSDDETVCKVCGKTLESVTVDSENEENKNSGVNNKEEMDITEQHEGETAEAKDDSVIENGESSVYEERENEGEQSGNLSDVDLFDHGKEDGVSDELSDISDNVEDAEQEETTSVLVSKEDEDSAPTDVLYKNGEIGEGPIVLENGSAENEPKKASGFKKFFGVLSILIALAGAGIIGVGVYDMMVNGSHFQYKNSKVELDYNRVSTSTDADLDKKQDVIAPTATVTDVDAVVIPKASKTDASNNDGQEVQ